MKRVKRRTWNSMLLKRAVLVITVSFGGTFLTNAWGIEIFRFYAMGENDPGAVIGGTNLETLDSVNNPDDIAGALVHLSNTDTLDPGPARYVEGRTGPGSLALDYNGYAEGHTAAFDPRNGSPPASFTAFSQAWLKPDSALAGTRQTIWALGTDLGTLVINEDQNWEMVINGGGGGPGFLATDEPVAFDEWTHVALLRTGGGGRLYVNGTIVGITTNFWNGPGSGVSVGANTDFTDPYDGAIDDFNIGSGADGSFVVAEDVDFWDDTTFSGVLGDVDPSQDGIVNEVDYQTWSDNVGFDNGFGFGDPGTLVRGDVDQNGRVNFFDFRIIYEQAALAGVILPVAVPEPSSMVLLLCVAGMAVSRRKLWPQSCKLVAVLGFVGLFFSSQAQADVIVAEDFFYNQPTKALGDNSGFAFQDYGGGQNGPAGNWVGRWGAIGDARITGPDHPEATEQYMGFTGDLYAASALVRSYNLTNVASNQTLYFSARILDLGSTDPEARFALNVPDGEAISEISMGFEGTSFVAQLGEDFTYGSTSTVDMVFHQLIGKLEINASGTDERLSVWIDPTGVETGPEMISVEADVVTGLDDTAFTGNMELNVLGGSSNARVAWWDDVAIGTTWEDVATVNVPRLTLKVDTQSGTTRLVNNTGVDFNINFIELHSDSGSLDDSSWNSLDNQGVDGGAWQENNPSASALTESNFGSSTPLADGAQLNLGQAFNTSGTQDIVARFGTDLGLFNLATVEYVVDESLPGDFDGNGSVGNSDLTLLLDSWGKVPADGWVNDVPAGTVGNDSLTILLDNWGNSALSAAGVPEPTALALLTLGCCSLALRRRK